MKLAADQCVDAVGARLMSIAEDREINGSVRARALESLGEIQPDGAVESLKKTLFDDDPRVRGASLSAFLAIDPAQAQPLLESALTASVPERRVAYQGLARIAGAHIDETFVHELTALDAGRLPPTIALDLVTAAEKRPAESVQALLAKRNEARRVDEKTARYLDSLSGGDAEKGREIFRGKTQLECLRCHVAEADGGIVGPNLKDVSKRLTRLAMLESIVDPNRVFAPGYQGTVVFPLDGQPVEGTVVEDKPDHITLRKSDATTVTIQRSDIDVIKPGLSAMPTNHAEHLSREEMRDLIEYLATL
jgi:quinoprotein glucose dehydrogenase